ncbi:MAG: hypothetical protein KatS3mg105_0767 [Gemmatales bacterium]|nr:MAG: hypothetical protein KatS3mg105_0767 [Gemmatales bacterium]
MPRRFASHIAQKRLEDHETVRQAFLTALSRPATAEETTDAIAFLKAQKKSYEQSGKKDSSFLALTDFCHALMCLNEFIYVE